MLVNISPDMSMYQLLRSQGYQPAYALAEFIDNALHAHQIALSECPDKILPILTVRLSFYSKDFKDNNRNTIIIDDDSVGIDAEKLLHALKPAKPPITTGLSEFGIGMKAAAVWFSNVWTLTTYPMAESKKYSIHFNFDELIKANKDTVEVNESKSGSERTGTTIRLSDLSSPITRDQYLLICQDLKEIYRNFTKGASPQLTLLASYDSDGETNLKFEVNDAPTLKAQTYQISGKKLYITGQEKEWLVPLSFYFRGHQITGQIEIRETGSYATNPGIILFRHNRVIQGLTSKPYTPRKLYRTSNKYSAQRVYGELHMDGLPVSYTKDRFTINENDLINEIHQLPGVIDLLNQAEAFRTRVGKLEVIRSDSAMDIPKKRNTARSAATDVQDSHKSEPTHAEEKKGVESDTAPKKTPTPSREPAPSIALLASLKSQTSSLALKAIIEEATSLYRSNKNIGTALCIRLILECGVLEKIRTRFPSEYPSVAHLGISSVIKHLKKDINTLSNKSQQGKIFHFREDHNVIKCIVGNDSATEHLDVLLLNNISHGHYNPAKSQIDKVLINIQPILEWAYS